MKKMILITALLFASSQASVSPTIPETEKFIFSVLKDSLKTEEKITPPGASSSSYAFKPKMIKAGECKYQISQDEYIETYDKTKKFNTKKIVMLNLAIHQIFLPENNTKDYNKLVIKDRQDLKTISWSYKAIKLNGDVFVDETYNGKETKLFLKFNGAYLEKMTKAFKHLSDLCYEKYGAKTKDPF